MRDLLIFSNLLRAPAVELPHPEPPGGSLADDMTTRDFASATTEIIELPPVGNQVTQNAARPVEILYTPVPGGI